MSKYDIFLTHLRIRTSLYRSVVIVVHTRCGITVVA